MEGINTELLMDEVKKREAIWNSSSETYKDRVLKKNQWSQLCSSALISKTRLLKKRLQHLFDLVYSAHHGSKFSNRAGKPWNLMSATTHDEKAAGGKISSPEPRCAERSETVQSVPSAATTNNTYIYYIETRTRAGEITGLKTSNRLMASKVAREFTRLLSYNLNKISNFIHKNSRKQLLQLYRWLCRESTRSQFTQGH
ncbi:hypothetical protein J6590_051363 [Homalodisca vitripennis]|nr:hypothetical protein J6590_051363 [Homalodisca vitripennis]